MSLLKKNNIHNLFILLLCLPFIGIFASCSLESVSQRGFVYPFVMNTANSPGSLTVKVRQRDDLFINIDSSDFVIDEKTSLYRAPFNIPELAQDKSYIFEISGNFHPTLSFPVKIINRPFILGAFESSLYAIIANNVSQPPYSISIQYSGAGAIIALTNPFSVGSSVCGQIIDRISLIEKDTGEPVAGGLKYFNFTSTGAVGQSFTPQFENFIIFNVPEGSYNLKYLTIDSSASYTQEVVVVSGYVSLGYQLPCQTFDTFDEFLK